MGLPWRSHITAAMAASQDSLSSTLRGSLVRSGSSPTSLAVSSSTWTITQMSAEGLPPTQDPPLT